MILKCFVLYCPIIVFIFFFFKIEASSPPATPTTPDTPRRLKDEIKKIERWGKGLDNARYIVDKKTIDGFKKRKKHLKDKLFRIKASQCNILAHDLCNSLFCLCCCRCCPCISLTKLCCITLKNSLGLNNRPIYPDS